MYFLLPHRVPVTWHSRAQTSTKAELPSGKVPTCPRLAADLPVEPLNDIVGTDPSPVLGREITVSQCLLNAVLHILGSLFQFHCLQLSKPCLSLCLFLFAQLIVLYPILDSKSGRYTANIGPNPKILIWNKKRVIPRTSCFSYAI